jgi:cell division protein FtsL
MKLGRSSLITKLIILVLAVYAAVTLVTLQSQISDKRAEAASLQTQIAAAEQENQRLSDAIEAANTAEGVRSIARSKLGFVTEGELVFYDVGN